jgi:hypothetical protein
MEDHEKKEKMDTRRNKAGWDTRKLYEIMLMDEIPGIVEYISFSITNFNV